MRMMVLSCLVMDVLICTIPEWDEMIDNTVVSCTVRAFAWKPVGDFGKLLPFAKKYSST